MMSEPKSGFQFDFEWRIALFTALLVPFMVGLGFWQLQRAEEKSAMAAAFEARQQQPPVPLSTLWEEPGEQLAYASVTMKGQFTPNEYFLLDNQMREGRVGYEVLDVLQLSSGGRVLVNRGWVAGGADRQVLPQVPRPEGEVEFTGHVYVAPGVPFLLAEQQLDDTWPKRIQAVEMDKLMPLIAARPGERVFRYPVRIDAGEPAALVTDWQIVNMSPIKHRAYAVQWFAMAAVLLVYYLMRSSNLWQLLRGSGRTGN
tara:strand:- start:24184 stop:24954 length:771 start_codon:yes stop_codon:yes gene_type:complete